MIDRAAARAATVSTAFALAAVFAVAVCRLAIWFPPSRAMYWQAADLWHAIGSCFQDYCVLLGLLCLHGAARELCGQNGSKRHATIELMFAGIYLGFIALIVSNVISIYTIGSVLDLSWLAGVSASSSSGTALATVSALLTRSMVILIIGCLIVTPILSFLAHRKTRKNMPFYVVVVAFMTMASGGLTVALSAPADSFSRTYKMRSPVVSTMLRTFFPSATERLLAGESGVDPEAERIVGLGDWLPQSIPSGVDACCKGMNVVLITLDSVPQRSVPRDYIMRHTARYPNLSALYRRGIAFDNFYANFPGSTGAMGVMLGAIPASNVPTRTSINEWTGRDVQTLPRLLVAHGYRSAHFMSGELAYDGVKQFLDEQGFSKIEDSFSLTCRTDDDRRRLIYSHIGDDCTARAAARWIDAAPPSPFFLWVWFTNPHTPYYTNRQPFGIMQGRSPSRHAEAIRDTDAAIGVLLRSIAARKLSDRTVIVVAADHGQAFGEHGLYYHGTSLHDEQVRIPLIIIAPGIVGDQLTDRLGSQLDLAPTIAGLLGLASPRAWEGQSLFAADRAPRIYFTALSGGRMAGYRQGNMKYIVSALEAQPFAYDLARDPGEQRPMALSPMAQRIVAARVGAFIRHRNGLRWAALKNDDVRRTTARANP